MHEATVSAERIILRQLFYVPFIDASALLTSLAFCLSEFIHRCGTDLVSRFLVMTVLFFFSFLLSFSSGCIAGKTGRLLQRNSFFSAMGQKTCDSVITGPRGQDGMGIYRLVLLHSVLSLMFAGSLPRMKQHWTVSPLHTILSVVLFISC